MLLVRLRVRRMLVVRVLVGVLLMMWVCVSELVRVVGVLHLLRGRRLAGRRRQVRAGHHHVSARGSAWLRTGARRGVHLRRRCVLVEMLWRSSVLLFAGLVRAARWRLEGHEVLWWRVLSLLLLLLLLLCLRLLLLRRLLVKSVCGPD